LISSTIDSSASVIAHPERSGDCSEPINIRIGNS
jgi:hypothetical protein